MIEQIDAKDAPGVLQTRGHLPVLAAGCGVAAGVVVHGDQPGGACRDRFAEDLTGVHDGGVQTADGDVHTLYDAVFSVQQH